MMMKNDDALFDNKMKERFSKETSKIPLAIDAEFKNTLALIKNQEDKKMRKLKNTKKVSIVAASILCALTITMQTTFAQDLVSRIIRSLSLNNITILENQDRVWEDRAIPEAAQGKVFDKFGNVVEKITFDNQDYLYTAEGEQILGVQPDGKLLTEAILKEMNEDDEVIVKDITQLEGYTHFDLKLPTYLPTGFSFDKAEFYKDDSGQISDQMCSVYFVNNTTGENIFINQTYIVEETAGETSFKNIEEIKVNGSTAILGDEGITWESNGVRYLMYTYDLGRAESIKIAESIR